jgi:hypothetical protein
MPAKTNALSARGDALSAGKNNMSACDYFLPDAKDEMSGAEDTLSAG